MRVSTHIHRGDWAKLAKRRRTGVGECEDCAACVALDKLRKGPRGSHIVQVGEHLTRGRTAPVRERQNGHAVQVGAHLLRGSVQVGERASHVARGSAHATQRCRHVRDRVVHPSQVEVCMARWTGQVG